MKTRELTKEFRYKGMGIRADHINVELGNIYAIQATNRQALIDAINQFVNSSFFGGARDKTYLHVELSGEKLGCGGCSADYATEADIPYYSVPCTCGNPKHWLIKYEGGNDETLL